MEGWVPMPYVTVNFCANVYVMETNIDHPGFARLRAVSGRNGVSLRKRCGCCPPGTCSGTRFYLSRD